MCSLQREIRDLLSYLSIINTYTPRGTELLKVTISFLRGSDSRRQEGHYLSPPDKTEKVGKKKSTHSYCLKLESFYVAVC